MSEGAVATKHEGTSVDAPRDQKTKESSPDMEEIVESLREDLMSQGTKDAGTPEIVIDRVESLKEEDYSALEEAQPNCSTTH